MVNHYKVYFDHVVLGQRDQNYAILEFDAPGITSRRYKNIMAWADIVSRDLWNEDGYLRIVVRSNDVDVLRFDRYWDSSWFGETSETTAVRMWANHFTYRTLRRSVIAC